MSDFDRLREAWLDFSFEVLSALGIGKLVRKLGMTPKPWFVARETQKRVPPDRKGSQ